MGFKPGILIGALATAVVSLGVTVALLAGSDDFDSGDMSTAVGPQPTAVVGTPCQQELFGGEIEVAYRLETLNCSEAIGLYAQYRESIQTGKAAPIGGITNVRGWACERFGSQQYPMLAKCTKEGERLVVDFLRVGPTDPAHTGRLLSSERLPDLS